MKQHAQVVVIGGGVVGASVLYHLTKAGWTDVMLLERRELTAGSTWHAAGGMHTLNGDPNVARLQQYTIQLYEEIQRVSGQDCSIHLPGGLMLADTEVRMDWLRMAQARGRYLGMELELITPKEAQDVFPLLDPKYFVGALYDPVEGHVDPSGVTRAYVKAAQMAGAEVHQHQPVVALEQRPDETWTSASSQGQEVHAEHVVNAGGLWAREVGRMVGIELPVLAMEHHYLLTVDMPEVAAQNAKTGHEMPMALDFARRDLHPPGRRRDAARHLRAGRSAVEPQDDPLGLRVAAAEARPRPHHARAVRSRSSTTRRWRPSVSAGSSTGRSRSRPTATRWSVRSAAFVATGSRVASWPGCRRAAGSASRSRRG